MRFFNPLMALGISAFSIICSQPATYYLELTPRTNNDVYEMKINNTVTFKAEGFQKPEQSALGPQQVEVDRAWWDFNKYTLLKVISNKNSITLKAIRPGTSKLTCSAIVRNQSYTKTITILVRDE